VVSSASTPYVVKCVTLNVAAAMLPPRSVIVAGGIIYCQAEIDTL
jgi:hypothetical protein